MRAKGREEVFRELRHACSPHNRRKQRTRGALRHGRELGRVLPRERVRGPRGFDKRVARRSVRRGRAALGGGGGEELWVRAALGFRHLLVAGKDTRDKDVFHAPCSRETHARSQARAASSAGRTQQRYLMLTTSFEGLLMLLCLNFFVDFLRIAPLHETVHLLAASPWCYVCVDNETFFILFSKFVCLRNHLHACLWLEKTQMRKRCARCVFFGRAEQ